MSPSTVVRTGTSSILFVFISIISNSPPSWYFVSPCFTTSSNVRPFSWKLTCQLVSVVSPHSRPPPTIYHKTSSFLSSPPPSTKSVFLCVIVFVSSSVLGQTRGSLRTLPMSCRVQFPFPSTFRLSSFQLPKSMVRVPTWTRNTLGTFQTLPRPLRLFRPGTPGT